MKSSIIKYVLFLSKLHKLTDRDDNVINSKIKTPDNMLLDTYFVKKSDSNKCIIFFHGNAGNLSHRFDMIKFLYNFASIVIFDYRSFGNSTGDRYQLSCDNLQIDANTIWNYVVNDLKFDPNNVSLFGESLGCSVAIYLAANLSKNFNNKIYPRAVILNSPFYSFSSMVSHMLNSMNIGFMARFLNPLIGWEYQSNVQIQKINYITKIVIAHSIKDEIIPYAQAVNLYNSISKNNKNSTFIQINGSHNDPKITDNYMYLLAEVFS